MTARSADRHRRQTQQAGVQRILRSNSWVSLQDFKGVKGMHTGIAARLRELRDENGHRLVECKLFEDGVWRYRKVR